MLDRDACPGVWGKVAVPDGCGSSEGSVITTPSISPEQPLGRDDSDRCAFVIYGEGSDYFCNS